MKSLILFIACNILLGNRPSKGEENKIQIEFSLFSCTLSNESKKQLDENVNFLREQIKDQKCAIVISAKTCKKELNKNKNIGLIRCRVVLDYIEKEYGISRSNFFIIDEHFDGLEDDNCTNVRFVKFRFICD